MICQSNDNNDERSFGGRSSTFSSRFLHVGVHLDPLATSISSALISGPTLPPASTARASPALGAPAGKRSRTRREKEKKKTG